MWFPTLVCRLKRPGFGGPLSAQRALIQLDWNLRGVNTVNATNTIVPGITFKEMAINLPIELDMIVLAFAYVFEAGLIAILLLNVV